MAKMKKKMEKTQSLTNDVLADMTTTNPSVPRKVLKKAVKDTLIW